MKLIITLCQNRMIEWGYFRNSSLMGGSMIRLDGWSLCSIVLVDDCWDMVDRNDNSLERYWGCESILKRYLLFCL